MPTSFTTITNGATSDANQLNQFAAPINALETLLGSLSAIELSYLLGVTSGIQAQLDAKAAASHTHTISQLSDWPGGLTITELGYLDGVTSSIQTQLTGKSDTSHNHTITALTGWPGGLTTTELGYLDGVTSAIQTQLDAKAALSHAHAASDITSGILAIARGGTGLGALGTALQAIRVNAGATALEFYTPSGGGASALDDLTDVVITSPATGHSLFYNGSNFINRALAIGDLPHQLAIFQRITSDQSYPGGWAKTLFDFNSELQDEGNNVSIASGTITFANTGRYRVTLQTITNVTGFVRLPAKNWDGSSSPFMRAVAYLQPDGAGYNYAQLSHIYDITAADTIKPHLISASSGSIYHAASADYATGFCTCLWIERLK